MKIIPIKKLYIALALGLGLIGFFILFGQQSLISIYNITHKELCLKQGCFEKPFNWLPHLVKKDNEIYILDFIPKKWLFWDKSNPMFSVEKNSILLMDKEDFCLIVEYEELPNIKIVPRQKQTIGNCKVEVGKKLLVVVPIYIPSKKLKLTVNEDISKERLTGLIESICK
ncbi:hypothetical protein JHD50_12525 [Sulfurimonas sp. MAG313]|nr:hypothetical protein [Sulfurimonas sp. MAG313]MDF1882114.1 hypothetical protein [Sulfurimonas sp. MAG313]